LAVSGRSLRRLEAVAVDEEVRKMAGSAVLGSCAKRAL
jgi:hypothetical protein